MDDQTQALADMATALLKISEQLKRANDLTEAKLYCTNGEDAILLYERLQK
jgi:hypothetical protein